MERIQNVQKINLEKMAKLQKVCDAKGYGRLSLGGAGAIMLFVFCPMSIVAVAAPYWTFSSEAQGSSMSGKASLWDISMSTEIQGQVSEVDMAMCGDENPGFDECGKVSAVRFFAIVALLLSLGAATAMIVAFLNLLSTTALKRKITFAGLGMAAATLLATFLGMCVAASIEMQEGYNLNGAGFVFLVLEVFFVMLAIGLVVYMLRYSTSEAAADTDGSQIQTAPETLGAQAQQTQPCAAETVSPTLLTANSPAQKEDLEKGAKTDGVSMREIVFEDNAMPSEEAPGNAARERTEKSYSNQAQAKEQISQEAVIEMQSARKQESTCSCVCPGM